MAASQFFLPSWRNWQTRMVQVHVLARVWGFESLRWHHGLRLMVAALELRRFRCILPRFPCPRIPGVLTLAKREAPIASAANHDEL